MNIRATFYAVFLMVAAGSLHPALAVTGQSEITMSVGTRQKSLPERNSLRVVVRHAGYAAHHNAILKANGGQDYMIISEAFAPGLELILVSDTPLTSKVIDGKMLLDMGMSHADAMALGRRQVVASLPNVPRPDDIDEGIITSPKIDYIASLLLADGWDELNDALGKRLLIAVPSDDQIVITTLGDDEFVRKISAYAKQMHSDATRSVSASLYSRRDGKWVLVAEPAVP